MESSPQLFNIDFIAFLVYAITCLTLAVISLILMSSEKQTNPVGYLFSRWTVIAFVPFIIIFGLLAVGKMLEFAGIF